MKRTLSFSFSQKAFEHLNLIRMIVRRKSIEFIEQYPNCEGCYISIWQNGDDFVSNRATLIISGYEQNH